VNPRFGSVEICSSSAPLIVVSGLDEGEHLPDLIGRKPSAKGRHLRPLASVDHDFEELFVAEFRGEDIWPASTGALVTNKALASIDIATGGNGLRPAEEWIGLAFICDRYCERHHPQEQSCDDDEVSSA
jgi:hypothetical protein